MKKYLIIYICLMNTYFIHSDLIIGFNTLLQDEAKFSNVNTWSLINENNKMELGYLTNFLKLEFDFFLKIPGAFNFLITPYVYIDTKKIEDKNCVGIKEGLFKFILLPIGLELNTGKYYINNTRTNIFTPLNYFDNYMKIDDKNRTNYDSSVAFTNIKINSFFNYDIYSLSFSVLWIPGFKEEFKKYYFLSSLGNYSEHNIFQQDFIIDSYDGWNLKILYAMIEKKVYNFDDGFYYILGFNNSIKITDNVQFYQELSISNGYSIMKIKKDKYKKNSYYTPQEWEITSLIEYNSTKSYFFLELVAGLDILLPQDVNLVIEYFFNERGINKGQKDNIYQKIEDLVHDADSDDTIPIQGTYQSLHKFNKFQKHYIGIQVAKYNIMDRIDIINSIIFTPTEISFYYYGDVYVKLIEGINLKFNLTAFLGMPKTEYGLELYNLFFSLELVCRFGAEKNIK